MGKLACFGAMALQSIAKAKHRNKVMTDKASTYLFIILTFEGVLIQEFTVHEFCVSSVNDHMFTALSVSFICYFGKEERRSTTKKYIALFLLSRVIYSYVLFRKFLVLSHQDGAFS
jgi:hypothetical protein